MNKLVGCVSVLFVLASCGGDEIPQQNEANKTSSEAGVKGGPQSGSGAGSLEGRPSAGGAGVPSGRGGGQGGSAFSIETQLVGDFQNNYSIQKIGQILPSQSLDINAQVSGDVSRVHIKQGDKVVAGQTLISLSDSYSRYYLDIEKAQIDYDKQLITKQSQVTNIDQDIEDIARDLEDAERLYENALLTAEEDTKAAKITFDNSSTVDIDSSAYLALESAELDYDNILISNTQKLDGYIRDAQEEYSKLKLSVVDIIEFGDELFGITDRNKDEAQKIRTYFGVLDSSQKNDTEQLLLDIMVYSEYLDSLDTNNISESTLVSFMDTYDEGYSLVSAFLDSLETTLNNSISSLGSLSDSDISGFVSRVNSFQSSNQGNLTSYGSTLQVINSFLSSYKEDEISALKKLELTQKNYENSEENASISYNKTLINIDNTLSAVKKSRDRLLANYENALADREITIRSLDNSISSAKNTLTKAQVEYSKLSITAPISGVINSVEIDAGEYITAGKQVFNIVGDAATQIEVSLAESEVQDVSVGDFVKVEYVGEEYEGEVFSISSVADDTLNYNVTVILNEDFGLVGGSAKVLFQDTESVGVSLPFNLVTVTEEDTGTINIFREGKLETLEVSLGDISGSNIEILSSIPEDAAVITTDLGNYNANTQTLTLQ